VNPSDLVNKTVVIGLTFLNQQGEVDHRAQLAGTITSVGEDVVRIELTNGEEYTLPPDLDAFQPGKPGIYRSKTTGEVIENPDFITTWTIAPPDGDRDK
jgi:hypothetical protein